MFDDVKIFHHVKHKKVQKLTHFHTDCVYMCTSILVYDQVFGESWLCVAHINTKS